MANPSQTEELERLHARAAEIRANTVCARSRAVYKNSYARFLVWLITTRSPRLQPAFVRRVADSALTQTGSEPLRLQTGEEAHALLFESLPTDPKLLRTAVTQTPDGDSAQPPLRFQELRSEDLVAWLLTLRTATGAQLSFSALNTHHAGLFNLFRMYKENMSNTLERGLTDHFKGLKRSIAVETATGGGQPMKVGKDPLSFDLYKYLCSNMLADSSVDMVFAPGDRPRDPRHIYANPLEPAVCPILALGIYWSIFSFDPANGRLFPGGSQYDRFRKELSRVLGQNDVSEDLKRQAVKPEDIGTLSLRKGAATFASSGSTACPSSTAVNLRAGWSLGGVQNTYLRYEAAGDMHVGRTVTGLPPDSHTFACLPPHFHCCGDQVESAISVQFPGAPMSIRYILEFALASLIYHRAYLKDTLSPSHALSRTPLFATPSMLTELSGHVIGGTLLGSCALRPTGVPPHVSILSKMASLQQNAEQTLERIDTARTAIVKDVVGEIERRAMRGGTVTYDGLNTMIMQCLDSAGVTAMVNHLQQNDLPVTPAVTNEPLMDLQQWTQQFNSIPASFSIPECTVYQTWILWQCGIPAMNIPPLRLVEPRQLANTNAKKRLSDFSFLNRTIERQAATLDLKCAGLDVHEAETVFRECSGIVQLPTTTAKGRMHRRGQLLWRTVVNELRAAKRRLPTS